MAVISGVYSNNSNSSTLYFTLTLFYVYRRRKSFCLFFFSFIYTFILNLSYLILKIASNKTIAYGRYMCTSRLLKWLYCYWLFFVYLQVSIQRNWITSVYLILYTVVYTVIQLLLLYILLYISYMYSILL